MVFCTLLETLLWYPGTSTVGRNHCQASPRAAVTAPQTGWLKTTGICCLPVLGARSPKSRCCQGCALSEGSRAQLLRASLQFLVLLAVLRIPWFTDTSLQSLPPPSHGVLPCIRVFVALFMRTPATGFGGHPNPYGLLLNYLLIISTKTLYSKVTFVNPEVRT